MDKIELLERHFKAFINIENTRDFFIGMADYLEFADSTKEFEVIMDGLLDQAKKKQEKLDTIGEEVVVVCDGMKKKIEKYIKVHKIETDFILKKFDFYNQLKDGGAMSSLGIPLALHQCIEEVIIATNNLPEHLEFVKQYAETIHTDQRPMVSRLIPFKEYEEYRELSAEIEREEKTTLWGQLERISHLYGAFKRGRESINQLMKSHKEEPTTEKSWKIMNYGILVEEWIGIEEDRRTRDLYYFKVDEVKPWLTRIHNHLISKAVFSPTPVIDAKILENSLAKPVEQIKIRKITLRQEDLMLDINGGTKIIPFKARKSKGEDEETKLFKIVYHLWDFREEISKSGKLAKQGEWVTLKNLTKGAESTDGSTTRNVSRLRDKFKADGVAIEIKSSKNGKYKLVVRFG